MKKWIINNKKIILDSIFAVLGISLIIGMGITCSNKIIEHKLTKEVLKEYQNKNDYEVYLHYSTCRLYTISENGIDYVVNDKGEVMHDQECLLSKEGVEE